MRSIRIGDNFHLTILEISDSLIIMIFAKHRGLFPMMPRSASILDGFLDLDGKEIRLRRLS